MLRYGPTRPSPRPPSWFRTDSGRRSARRSCIAASTPRAHRTAGELGDECHKRTGRLGVLIKGRDRIAALELAAREWERMIAFAGGKEHSSPRGHGRGRRRRRRPRRAGLDPGHTMARNGTARDSVSVSGSMVHGPAGRRRALFSGFGPRRQRPPPGDGRSPRPRLADLRWGGRARGSVRGRPPADALSIHPTNVRNTRESTATGCRLANRERRPASNACRPAGSCPDQHRHGNREPYRLERRRSRKPPRYASSAGCRRW